MPDYKAALSEFYRCVTLGGTVTLSVPFSFDRQKSQARAIIAEDGKVTHMLPPECHGDPLDSSGVLCFHNFGWDFLDSMRDVRSRDVALTMFWSGDECHLGRKQFLIAGQR